ncbi:pyridoxal-phosphate dependent enzyme [Streptomyces sp. HNM0663]|uniref:Pyridoxal-phosphate dependent enzyme n=1 Tax=Streptomyces chengmaiensis TaxID=3040919 RepID=A0ABT6HQI2_9ACTN|nr:pyridoxal-phosphate dependent enzyme [Streptomyces chengmaiensis]MDH2390542.1 pyridoxal-phosphate dependent enzyme [Streptomyces chengmaiensis]
MEDTTTSATTHTATHEGKATADAPAGASLATAQRSLGDRSAAFPLWPVLTAGCPSSSTADVSYPLEVDYAYDRAHPGLFDTLPSPRSQGLERFEPLMPPLHAPGLAEGGTPLVGVGDGVYIKDESRNPTWSHKDRLNRCTVSAAVGSGAQGVVVASSGNHGASAAAFAARAGLRCVVLTAVNAPPAIVSFLRAYDAVVLPVPLEESWPLLRKLSDRLGLHPVSNSTPTHTGHPFGPEGYKSIAYEIHQEVGVPSAVFVPTGYGELLFGVWKGFSELRRLGVASRTPRMFACEPAAGAPLAAALRRNLPAARVPVGPTDAYAISCEVSGYRAAVAVRESGGDALPVDDEAMRAAQRELAGHGLWAELSSAAGLAGLRVHGARRQTPGFDGPVVCISTSSGFKGRGVGAQSAEPADPGWDAVVRRLRAAGLDTA